MELDSLSTLIALTLGVGWASGINLYAAVLALGLAGTTGYADLPTGLELVENPFVIAAAGVMYLVEFCADKIPGVDSAWDALHTFIRLPAGALLAAGIVGDQGPVMEALAGVVGGGLAASTHAAKAGGRALINTSPEPFSNWAASITEDAGVFGAVWLMLNHPWVFVGCLVIFVLLLIWLLPKIWRAIRYIFKKIGALFGGATPEPLETTTFDQKPVSRKKPN